MRGFSLLGEFIIGGSTVLPLVGFPFAAQLSRSREGGERGRRTGDQQFLHVIQLNSPPPLSHHVRLLVPVSLQKLFPSSLSSRALGWRFRLFPASLQRCTRLYGHCLLLYSTTSSHSERAPGKDKVCKNSLPTKFSLKLTHFPKGSAVICCSLQLGRGL